MQRPPRGMPVLLGLAAVRVAWPAGSGMHADGCRSTLICLGWSVLALAVIGSGAVGIRMAWLAVAEARAVAAIPTVPDAGVCVEVRAALGKAVYVMFFDDPEAAFANIARALRLAFLCWQPVRANPFLAVPLGAVAAFAPPPDLGPAGAPGAFSLADPDRVTELLGAAGYEEGKSKRWRNRCGSAATWMTSSATTCPAPWARPCWPVRILNLFRRP